MVTLTWSPPASDGGSQITAYKIYRGTASGGEVFVDTASAGTGYVDNNVANGTTYFYKVSAVNGLGEGALSNEKSATPAVPATVPDPPILNPPGAGDRSVTLTWITPGSGGSPITGYRIYRGTASGAGTFHAAVGTVDTYTDTAVTNGTTYYYVVTAVNGVGESGPSQERPAMPVAVPSAPTLTSAAPGDATVALAWSAPLSDGGAPITAYTLYRSAGGGPETLLATVDAFVTTYQDDSAANGTTYAYRVAAVNVAGESARSNQRTAIPATVPSAPVVTATTALNGSVTVIWSAPPANGSAITGYRLYRAVGTGNSMLLTTLGNTTSYVDTAVTNLTIYDYRVTAVNALGEGPLSNIGTAVPASTTYGAPGWWNGDCDATWWNPRAQALGWQGEGAHRLGAAYLGIPVCGPAPGNDAAPLVSWGRGGQAMNEWDASEYVLRFMDQVYGVAPYAASPMNVVRAYAPGAGGGLQFVANGTAGSPPKPGDVISFDNANGVGLVAVVGWIELDANGTGKARIIAQNDTGGGWRRLDVTNWNVQGFGGNTAYGWLHDPQGRGSGGSEAVTAPDAPALDPAVPGNSSVTLTWSTPASGGSPITGYKIYRGTSSGTATLLATVAGVNTYVDTTAVNGTTYVYRVGAVNAFGEGAASNERSATPSGPTEPGSRSNPVAPAVVVPRPSEPTAPATTTQRPPQP
jgi:fibronectin type 3 domain-containing protein